MMRFKYLYAIVYQVNRCIYRDVLKTGNKLLWHSFMNYRSLINKEILYYKVWFTAE